MRYFLEQIGNGGVVGSIENPHSREPKHMPLIFADNFGEAIEIIRRQVKQSIPSVTSLVTHERSDRHG